MDTLLVIGVDRVIGANLAQTLADRFQVTGLPGHVCEDEAALRRQLLETSPAWTVHVGHVARSSWDVEDVAEDHLAREPRIAATLAEMAERIDSSLTVLTSDAVFAGPRLYHTEGSPALGVGPLAEAARATEEALQGSRALIARTHAYGWSPAAGGTSDAERFWESLTSGISPSADAQPHATPILASDLAVLLEQAYRAGLHGVYHFGGGERTNPRRFLAELTAALGIDTWHHQEESSVADPVEPISETSLVSRRLREALGHPLPMLREGLRRFAEQRDNGYRDGLPGSTEPVLRASAA